MMRLVLFLLTGLVLAGQAFGQLQDVDFRPQTAPGNFNGNDLFQMPAGPPDIKPDAPLWSGQVEFGVNGSEGNANVLNVRLGALAMRQSEGNILTSDFLYMLSRQNNQTAADKALYNIRDEMFFKDSPWGMFLAGQLEYDQFRDFDLRVATHTGFAYQFIRTDETLLRTRVGAGASREFGSNNDRWVPEGLFGFDLFHQITRGQNVLLSFDYYPDLGRLAQYRIRARAAYEIALDPECRIRLRVGLQDRYDSSAGTAKSNDLDYFTTILFKF